ncbi:MAG: chromosomal replication initiator protein DnaA [Candidatus Levybacteria bacterium CG10_big_fil_rev_8_21_14_0_10_36_7]|nr:MAG: chromosomal replication initiator protein DnaA [Candidatus Levybacteria bacterium CG10_big_fil_rev_8_21_14_0_10_36_7]
MEDLWKSVLAELEVEVSKPVFLTFFKPTTLVSIEKSIATISASTQITAEYIERRYYSLIKKILDRKTKENLSLVFSSETKRAREKNESGPLFARDVKNVLSKKRPTRIRQDYTFDSLAVSESNQLAFTGALEVAKNPGVKYNPLFLYGTVGVGKTHLMNAVANMLFDEDNETTVLYLTTEEFTNEVVEAIRDKTTTQLRKKFRNVDVLLLDDIQFLGGKERVQEELFHTFNTLIDKGGQIILSSDKPPQEIRKIEKRLASRFEGGLSIDIQPPDFELRTAILLIKSQKYGLTLDVETAKIAAEKIEDTRALEGFLLKLASYLSTREDKTITEKIISLLLGKVRSETKIIHPDNIIEAVCNYFNIKPTQIKGVKRDAYLVRPRHICMYLLKEDARLTYVEIGNLLGGRDHTTVMHGVEKVGKILSDSQNANEEIMLIKRKIKEDLLQ